jgi:myo-inositol-1(or 4)-monophosphatase
MSAWDGVGAYCLIEAAGGQVLPFPAGPAMLDPAPVLGARPGVFDEMRKLARLDDAAFWVL